MRSSRVGIAVAPSREVRLMHVDVHFFDSLYHPHTVYSTKRTRLLRAGRARIVYYAVSHYMCFISWRAVVSRCDVQHAMHVVRGDQPLAHCPDLCSLPLAARLAFHVPALMRGHANDTIPPRLKKVS
jgi:hypothetical protein